ncbi:MAG: Bax inhibitor-1/YccA family protein [bacterium]
MENINKTIQKSFLWMFFGLLITSLVSYYCYATESLQSFLYGSMTTLMIVQVVVVIVFVLFFKKLPANVVAILFLVYAVLTGVSFSSIFYFYELGSIMYIFGGSAILFLALSAIGHNTEKDLSNMGSLLTVGLVVGLILTLVNVFIIKNTMMDIVLTWVLLGIFMGLVIYDVNKLKQAALSVEDPDKMHIYFAMELYLDFINIFIRLLSLFGKEK